MNCKEIKNNMIAYLEKDLSEEEMLAFRLHLPECYNCRSLFENVQAAWQVMEDEKQIKPDPFYFIRLQQAIDAPQREKSPFQFRRVPGQVRAFAAIVILLLSVAGGIYIGKGAISSFNTGGENEYEYFSNIMYLNSYENEPIENFLLNREEE